MIINKENEYKHEEYTHFIREYTGETRKIKLKNGGERTYREYVSKEIPFEELLSVNLNKQGEPVPFTSNGVINVNRYMFWFWTPIMQSTCISLFTLLTEYCDDDTDICYPKEQELAERLGITRQTVGAKLQVLQDNNFIWIINRYNKLANNKETSPIYKIRKNIPLLSHEQYSQLPKYLQNKHDHFMSKYGQDTEMMIKPFDSGETLEKLKVIGQRMITKRERAEIERHLENKDASEHIFRKQLTMFEQQYCVKLRERIQEKYSKPAYEGIYNDIICTYNDLTNTADVGVNELGKTAILHMKGEERLAEIITEVFELEQKPKLNIYSFKELVMKKMRGN